MTGVRTMHFVIMVFFGAALWPAFGQQMASADSFPSRPLRVIVGYAAGGPSDSGARLMAEPFSRQLRQPVIVIDQPGGGGLNSTESYASYPPDGYTLLLGAIGPLTVIPAAEKVNYDPIRDFAPLGLVWTSPLTLAVKSQPWHQVAEGFHRIRQSQSGQAYHRVGRCRLGDASRHCVVYARGRH